MATVFNLPATTAEPSKPKFWVVYTTVKFYDGYSLRQLWLQTQDEYSREDIEQQLITGELIRDGLDQWIDEILFESSQNVLGHFIGLVVGAYLD